MDPKPCPLCGVQPEIIFEDDCYHNISYWRLECPKHKGDIYVCGVNFGAHKLLERDDTIKEWNKRVDGETKWNSPV